MTLNQSRRAGQFLIAEAFGNSSRENITILSGEGVIEPGQILGKVGDNQGAVTVGAAAAAAGNTGNGAVTLPETPYAAGIKEGTYRAVCIEPATNLGKFSVEDPDGVTIGIATVGTLFDGVIKFTIADGATDFVAGDAFTFAVAIAAGANLNKYRKCDPTNTDGSQVASALAFYGVDATSADVVTVCIGRNATVITDELVYDAGADDAAKKLLQRQQLAAVGILAR